MKLRILSMLLSLLLLLTMAACAAVEEEPVTSETESATDTSESVSESLPDTGDSDPGNPEDIFTTKTDDNGNVIVTSLKDLERTVYTIPEGVTEINKDLFKGHETVEKIILPSTLKTIGRAAFDGCISLEEIEIPAGVTVIPERAFNRCERMSTVVLPEGVTTIETNAFGFCVSLYDVTIPESVTRIYRDAFAGCTELIEVTKSGAYYIGNWVVDCKVTAIEDELRDGVVGIADGAFYEVKDLETLVLPATLKYIGAEAFGECGDLVSLKIDKTQDEKAPNTLPASLVSIGEAAFTGCSDLTNITIPASVTEIGAGAFIGCSSIKSIAVEEGNTVYAAKNNCLIDIASKTLLVGCRESVIPADGSVEIIGDYAFEKCTALKTVTIPAGVTEIGAFAFSGCKKLETVNLSDGLVKVGESAFDSCAVLKTIVLPETVTEIGPGAFYKCAKLTSMVLPAELTVINPSTFAGCTGLESVEIPAKVTTLGEKAFASCKKLSSVTLPEGLTAIGISAFEKCTAIVEIAFPSTLKTIGESGFAGCSAITSLAFPASLEILGNGAFSSMLALESITVEDGNATYNAMGNCLIRTKSKTLILGCKNSKIPGGGTVTIIGMGAFEKNTELKDITIPAGVTSIGASAFAKCSSLQSVTIAASVLQIGNDAFMHCTSLFTVNYTGTADAWSAINIGKNNAKLTDKATGASIYYNYNDTSSEEISPEELAMKLNGLNVLAMGDSLFQGAQNSDGLYQWINVLGRDYNWNLTNLGIGGASISYQPDKNLSNVSMYNMLFNHFDKYKFGSGDSDDPRYFTTGAPSGNCEDVDLILLQAGSNDYGKTCQAPLGTVGSTDPSTFLGAWKLVVEKLLEVYPNATVVMMTAWHNGNQTRYDNANAIEYTSSVVDLYEAVYKNNDRVALIDSGNPEVSGVYMQNAEWRERYSHDAFHLKDDGMVIMGNAMKPLLYEIVKERE